MADCRVSIADSVYSSNWSANKREISESVSLLFDQGAIDSNLQVVNAIQYDSLSQ